MKAVFFDRDNTLIEDSGYMHKPEQLKFFPDTFSLLQKIQGLGFKLFIVTNQSGIGRGYFPESDMHEFHRVMLEELQKNNITITDLVYCPHSPEDNCDCRKPKPKLINQLCEKYQIDKSQSFMVGDKDADKQAGENAGITGIKIIPGQLAEILSILSN